MSDPNTAAFLTAIAEKLAEVSVKLDRLLVNAPPAVAPDDDLDGPYGNPEIKAADPRDWHGPTMRGRKFSECPPEYLDLLAKRLDYFAVVAEKKDKRTEKGKPVAPYNRRDAERARGWAARMRSGKTPMPRVEAAATVEHDFGGDADFT